MKKYSLKVLMVLTILATSPIQMHAGNKPSTAVDSRLITDGEVESMKLRLDEIKSMDMSTLAKQDKKELRKEVRTIKQKLMSTGNGVYISVGAIIIILLLIIIIL
jgi:hypothetical protein